MIKEAFYIAKTEKPYTVVLNLPSNLLKNLGDDIYHASHPLYIGSVGIHRFKYVENSLEFLPKLQTYFQLNCII